MTATSWLTIAALTNVVGNTVPVLFQFERYFFYSAIFGLGLGFFKKPSAEKGIQNPKENGNETGEETGEETGKIDSQGSQSAIEKLDAGWAVWLAAASGVLFLFTCGDNRGGLASVMALALLDQSHDIFDFALLKHGVFTDLLTVLLSAFLLLASVQIFVGPGRQLKNLLNKGSVKQPILTFGAAALTAWGSFALIAALGVPPAILFVFTFCGYISLCRKQKLCATLSLFAVMSTFYASTADLPVAQKCPAKYKAMASKFWLDGSRIDTQPLVKDDKLIGLCLYSDRELTQVLTLPQLSEGDAIFIQKHFELPPFPLDFRQLPYLALPSMQGKNALVLGSAIGAEVAACLSQHPAHVTAVDPSPWLTRASASQTFSPYKNAAVNLVIDDPRNFLSRSRQKYDLIIYTEHAAFNRPSPFLSFNHNDFLFTQESFGEARGHLKAGGQIMIISQAADELLRLRLAATMLAADNKIEASLTTPFANYLIAASGEESFAPSNTLVPALRKSFGGKIVNHEQWIAAGAKDIAPFADNRPNQGALAPMMPLADTFFTIMTLLMMMISMRLATPSTMMQNIIRSRCKIILLASIYMLLTGKALSLVALQLGLIPEVTYGSIIFSWIVFSAAALTNYKQKSLPGSLLWTAFAISLGIDFAFNYQSAFTAPTGAGQILSAAVLPWLSPFFMAALLAQELDGDKNAGDHWGLFLLGLALGGLFAASALFNGIAWLDLLAAFLACLSGLLTGLSAGGRHGIIKAT